MNRDVYEIAAETAVDGLMSDPTANTPLNTLKAAMAGIVPISPITAAAYTLASSVTPVVIPYQVDQASRIIATAHRADQEMTDFLGAQIGRSKAAGKATGFPSLSRQESARGNPPLSVLWCAVRGVKRIEVIFRLPIDDAFVWALLRIMALEAT